MRFFHPNEVFWKWIEEESKKYKFVIDCGCGEGHLVKEINERNIKCLGIDPRYLLFDEIPKNLYNRILPASAEDSHFILEKDVLLLVCRPCHNGFPALINDKRNKTNSFYYIGFEKNFEFDLEEDPKLILENVGEDGENLYKVS